VVALVVCRGIDTLISHETGIVTHIANDPHTCVVLGTGKVLENFKQLKRVFSDRAGSLYSPRLGVGIFGFPYTLVFTHNKTKVK
jgi:hypothetical protein